MRRFKYTDWIEIIRSNTHPQIASRYAARWRVPYGDLIVPTHMALAAEPQPRPYFSRRGMQFQIASTPATLEGALRDRLKSGYTARAALDPHHLPPHLQDFEIPYLDGSTPPGEDDETRDYLTKAVKTGSSMITP
jgi:hypothetical protein